jgi:hypothetical protein
VHLTAARLHDVALAARAGFRDCLSMIALHGADRGRAFLNPGTVVNAVATWERFALDLIAASRHHDWSISQAGWDEREYSKAAPWPDSRADRDPRRRIPAQPGHALDVLLHDSAVLDTALTARWQLFVPTSWRGADPTGWRFASYGLAPNEDADLIRRAILGAKSARDAASHRLYFKKAAEAQGIRRPDDDVQDDEHVDWCYVWQSDNTCKKTDTEGQEDYPGRPTIQSGYVRGVVAVFLQLVDQSIAVVQQHHGWTSRDSRLPAEWFNACVPYGPFANLIPWGGQQLHH